ncbi:MAG TPA: sugar kinase [Flavobacteriales bacterium]|nr:sugar kinase [Flavobacteriales bacterium]HIN39314.1 sugar kinase [Flavobacteriales bacterium]
MSLLVVGTVAFDAIETPFGKTDKIIGGAATYIGLAASYFTSNLKLVSVIGSDFPQESIDLMEERGIDTEGLQVKQGEKSFFWSGKYHNDMNTRDTLATELNVLEHFDPLLPESYKDSEFVMLGNLTPSVQMRVLEQLTSKPKLVVMDTMNFWMDIALDDLKEVIRKVDVLTINDEEARQLSGEYSLVKAAKIIREMGPEYLVIKKGEHGALLFHKDRTFYSPALPLEEVFDPTGAGDTFAGGFIGFLASTEDLSFDNMKRGIIYGSAMASFCVEKFGTESLIGLSREDINSRVKQFAELVHFPQ